MKMKLIDRGKKYKIATKLSRYFMLAFTLPILLVGIFISLSSFNSSKKAAQYFLEESTTQISTAINDFLSSYIKLIDITVEGQNLDQDLQAYRDADWDSKSAIENHIRLVLDHAFGANSSIHTTELIGVEGGNFYNSSPISNGNFATSSFLSTLKEQVQCFVVPKEVSTDKSSYIILTRGIYSKENKLVGGILTAVDLNYFNQICSDNVNSFDNSIFIIDRDDKVVASSQNEELTDYLPMHSASSVFSIRTIDSTPLKIENHIPYVKLMESTRRSVILTITITIMMAVITYLIAKILSKSITNPVDNLIQVMKEKNMKKYVEDRGKDEHHELIEGFNKMNKKINDALEFQYQSKLSEAHLSAKKKEAELSALQQQINPHFLYNTLECIYWNGQLEGDEGISSFVNSLGKYLRSIINKGREYILIQDEIEAINNYIFLQNKRFENRISCFWKVEKKVLKIPILKLLCQPIVEDILSGCLDYIEDEIAFSVDIWSQDHHICVVFHGMAPAAIMRLEKEEKVILKGINNVTERLQLFYGKEYRIIKDYINARITIRIPAADPKIDAEIEGFYG